MPGKFNFMTDIHVHWSWLVFAPIIIVLLILTFYLRESNHGNFTPDTSVLSNLFWGIVTVVFSLIWGGFFWW